MSMEELLTYRKKDELNKVTLVLPFYHKFKGDPTGSLEILNRMTCNPGLKQIFPDLPMISFRQASNIQDKLVQANHYVHKSYQPILPTEGNLILMMSLTTPKQLLTPSVTKRVI